MTIRELIKILEIIPDKYKDCGVSIRSSPTNYESEARVVLETCLRLGKIEVDKNGKDPNKPNTALVFY